MVAKRRKKSRKWLKWMGLLVLVATAAVICFLVINNVNGNNNEGESSKPDSSEVVEADKKSDTEGKSSITEAQPERDATGKKKIIQYEGADPNEEAEETGVLTGALTHASVDNGQLVVRVNINQSLGSGTCTLSLNQGGASVYTEAAPVILTASTATCEGFNVDVSGLAGGETEIVIKVVSGDKVGEIRGSVAL